MSSRKKVDVTARLISLRRDHTQLDELIQWEHARKVCSNEYLKVLKRRKLHLKEEIRRLEALQRSFTDEEAPIAAE